VCEPGYHKRLTTPISFGIKEALGPPFLGIEHIGIWLFQIHNVGYLRLPLNFGPGKGWLRNTTKIPSFNLEKAWQTIGCSLNRWYFP